MSNETNDYPKVQESSAGNAIDQLAQLRKTKPQSPSLKMDFDEEHRTLSIQLDSEDQALATASMMLSMGTSDDRVFSGLLKQISNIGEQGKAASEDASNFVLGIIDGLEPQDDVEAMLATQMAVTHQTTMLMARRLIHVETIPQQDAAERAFNKLARTFVAQTEALKRYRAKAQQTVRVERVTVNEGGKAIVGNVGDRGRAKDEK
ncbi:MAG: hypothetical protein ABJF50_11600 [Paracoccaceae bacterium]